MRREKEVTSVERSEPVTDDELSYSWIWVWALQVYKMVLMLMLDSLFSPLVVLWCHLQTFRMCFCSLAFFGDFDLSGGLIMDGIEEVELLFRP